MTFLAYDLHYNYNFICFVFVYGFFDFLRVPVEFGARKIRAHRSDAVRSLVDTERKPIFGTNSEPFSLREQNKQEQNKCDC